MMCVRAGSRYALVDGDMHYFLAGSEDTLDRLAGERATIAGALDGDTIHVISVSTQ
jgi:endonuclease YncB( thermonuclease family)